MVEEKHMKTICMLGIWIHEPLLWELLSAAAACLTDQIRQTLKVCRVSLRKGSWDRQTGHGSD